MYTAHCQPLSNGKYKTAAVIHMRKQIYLNPANADQSLRQLLHGQGKEQGECELDGAVERHGDKHTAGGDGVAQESVGGEGNKDYDLTAGKEGGHVESS